MNAHLPDDARVAAYAGENRYYLEVEAFASITASRSAERLSAVSDPADFQRVARETGYTHLFVNWSWTGEATGANGVYGSVPALSPENRAGNLEVLYDDGYQALFAITGRGGGTP